MQRYCTELTNRLLQSLDKEYNVIDMAVVVEVISNLEKTTITKEVLEITRLGKHINELRRKTSNEALAKRAKDLVRRWRDMVLPAMHPVPQPPAHADMIPLALNGGNPQCSALRNLKPQSPAIRGVKPQSPLCRTNTSASQLPSPALLLQSDKSRSPIASPNKQSITVANNHKINLNNIQVDPKFVNQNHSSDAVPRTHSSNKRLRKEDGTDQDKVIKIAEVEQANKKPCLNGESVGDVSEKLQVPSPTPAEQGTENAKPSEELPASPPVVVPKKRGRKKGSKSVKRQVLVEDRVKEKLASISRNPKLKTTQELLAELQARGSNLNLNASHAAVLPKVENSLSNNDKEISKHLTSNQNNFSHKGSNDSNLRQKQSKVSLNCDSSQAHIESDTLDDDTCDSEIIPEDSGIVEESQELTVKQILAKLPPLDLDSIIWSDQEHCNEASHKNVQNHEVPEQLDRLHNHCVECLNGNFEPKLVNLKSDSDSTCKNDVNYKSVFGLTKSFDSSKNAEFREWHEMLARPSCDGQILHILPYVIID